MLALRVDFLTGVSQSTRHNDPQRTHTEWPPHPDRLFSALVAAAASESAHGKLPKGRAEALQWLCELSGHQPPCLAASEGDERISTAAYVPTNPHPSETPGDHRTGSVKTVRDKKKAILSLLPAHRKKAVLPIPAFVPDNPTVYFIWPKADPNPHLIALHSICEQVTYLGRSRSLVQVRIVEDVPPATFVPDPHGDWQLRVPGRGRLEYLAKRFEQGLRPEPSPPRRYRRVDRKPVESEALPSRFERFWIFQPSEGDPRLPAESTLLLTQTLRKALIPCIKQALIESGKKPVVPDVVHGHGSGAHCAYVALPFAHPWQPHADGLIKGVAILIPNNTTRDDLRTIAAGLARLRVNGLGISRVGTWRLREVFADDPPNQTLDSATWTRPARTWATATPMVFGHYPKPNKGGEGQIVLDSLSMIGIPPEAVQEVTVDRHSELNGAPPSWVFRASKQESHVWLRHITVRFSVPVCGPLVIGRLRHFGLGIMRPLKGEQ